MKGLAMRVRNVYRRFALLPFLLLSARYHRYRSDLGQAKGHLISATRLVPRCFNAHLRLGALYLEEHDFNQAKREFLLAREINPGKFRRLYPLITGRSGDININLFYFPGFTDLETDQAPADFLREFIGEPLDDPVDESITWGDFASYREFRRFQELGPFRRDETREIDWDEILRRLPDEDGPIG
jgi:tetratricopeptide (TPR) repeat protein